MLSNKYEVSTYVQLKSGLINKRNIFDLHMQLHSLLANHLTTFWKKIGTMAPRLRLIILALFLVMLDDSQGWKQPSTQTPPICSLRDWALTSWSPWIDWTLSCGKTASNGENSKRLNWPIALDFPHIYIAWTFLCRSGVAISGAILAALRALKLCDQFA